MAAIHKGRCFCGAVEFEAEGDPAMQGYCHCADCRSWSGAPVTAYALWPSAATRITKGADKVLTFQRGGQGALRRTCAVCGGAIQTEVPFLGLTDIYPSLLPDFDFQPSAHVQCAESVLQVEDALPKFDRWPEPKG